MKIKKKKDYLELDFGKSLSTTKILAGVLVILTLGFNLLNFSTNTGVWWDEAEYLSFVNHIVDSAPYSMWEGRAIFYPLMLSLFAFINNSETMLRIGLLLINALTVLFSFLVLKKLFNEKIAFIATLFFLTNDLFRFFSLRFLTSIPSMMFILIGLYFYLKNDTKSKLISGVLFGFATATRFTSIIIVPALIIYEIWNKNKDIKSYAWIPAILLGFLPTMIFDVVQGEAPWNTLVTFFTQSTMARDWGANLGQWYFYLTNLPTIAGINDLFLLILWIILFFIGFFSLIFRLKKKKEIIIILLFSLFHLLAYSFMTPLKEHRYIIPILPFIYAIISIGIINVSKSIAGQISKAWKYKHLELIITGLITALFVLTTIPLANNMITSSSNSYQELGMAGALLKTIPSNQIIMTNAGPHVSYYSEKEVTGFPANMTDLINELNNNANINYLVISFYETTPAYTNDFINNSYFGLIKQYVRGNSTYLVILQYLRE